MDQRRPIRTHVARKIAIPAHSAALSQVRSMDIWSRQLARDRKLNRRGVGSGVTTPGGVDCLQDFMIRVEREPAARRPTRDSVPLERDRTGDTASALVADGLAGEAACPARTPRRRGDFEWGSLSASGPRPDWFTSDVWSDPESLGADASRLAVVGGRCLPVATGGYPSTRFRPGATFTVSAFKVGRDEVRNGRRWLRPLPPWCRVRLRSGGDPFLTFTLPDRSACRVSHAATLHQEACHG